MAADETADEAQPSNVVEFPKGKSDPTPRDELESRALALLDEIRHTNFPKHPEAHEQVFRAIQAAGWNRYRPEVQQALRSALQSQLGLSDARFDYCVRVAKTPQQLRKALHFRPLRERLEEDELPYRSLATGWLSRYLDYAFPGEGHIAFHFWAGIALLGAAMRRNFFLDERGDGNPHKGLYANLYLMLVGPSGCGKSTSIERAATVLERANELVAREFAHGEGDRPQPPVVGITPTKFNPASFSKWLEENRTAHIQPLDFMGAKPSDFYELCAISMADEATYLIGKNAWQSDQTVHMLTAAFGGKIDEATISRGHVKPCDVALTLLWGSTYNWLNQEITDTIFQGGFMGSRCLIIDHPKTNRSHPHPPPLDPVAQEELARELAEVMKTWPTELQLTPEGDEWYCQWYYNQQVPDTNSRVAGYLERRDVHLKKVAMVMAVAKGETQLTQETMQLAARLLEQEERTMLPAFNKIGRSYHEENQAYIEYVLGKAPRKMMRSKDLYAKVGHKFQGRHRYITEALDFLLATGRIRVLRPEKIPAKFRSKRGPPPKVFILNTQKETHDDESESDD